MSDTPIKIEALAEQGSSYLYFIQPVDGGLVKIGVTNGLAGRLASFQCGSPLELRVVKYIQVADRSFEFRVHATFAAHRRHGEWFDPCVLEMEMPDLLIPELLIPEGLGFTGDLMNTKDMNTKQVLEKLMSLGLTQGEIARQSGISQPTISRVINGVNETCYQSTAVAISELLEKTKSRRRKPRGDQNV